ncbi:MAG: hypothetical protein BGO25_03050 [Acidobacteriales bacterium 59-55]|nr:hypothetical protein [Terriglobales bacterium]OJV40141.1 MAG: hypothetical protein BGO25_03050 [Acidobacteriales bacterium 59-55]
MPTKQALRAPVSFMLRSSNDTRFECWGISQQYFIPESRTIVLKQRMQRSRGIFMGLEPLIGNTIWSGVAWVAVDRHLYGFLAAIVVFKILNELTLIQYQQSS